MEYPEPEEECLEAELEELSTECDHDTEDYCVGCAHIRDSKQDVTADKVSPLKNSGFLTEILQVGFSAKNHLKYVFIDEKEYF